jgi:hypothetical protein
VTAHLAARKRGAGWQRLSAPIGRGSRTAGGRVAASMRRFLLLAAGMLACGDDGSARPDAGGETDSDAAPSPDAASPDAASPDCPLSSDGRRLVAEIVGESSWELLVALQSGPFDRFVAHTLPGVAVEGYVQFGLAEECSGPSAWVTCSSELDDDDEAIGFFRRHDACNRVACVSAGLATMQSYWTMRPRREAEDRHPLRWRTTRPAGWARSDPNWLVAWTLDMRTADATQVSTELDRSLVVTPDGGDPAIDLTHTGELSASASSGGFLAGAMELDFPALAADGRPVRLRVELSPDPEFPAEVVGSGTIEHGGEVIAQMSGPIGLDGRLPVPWQGVCDTSSPTGLVGTWRARSRVDAPSQSFDAVYTFGADGTFTFDEDSDDHLAGTYTLDGDRLTLDGATPDGVAVRIESSIHLAASGELLLLEALRPDGQVDGVVGSWDGFLHIDAVDGRDAIRDGLDVELTLSADGTGELTERP